MAPTGRPAGRRKSLTEEALDLVKSVTLDRNGVTKTYKYPFSNQSSDRQVRVLLEEDGNALIESLQEEIDSDKKALLLNEAANQRKLAESMAKVFTASKGIKEIGIIPEDHKAISLKGSKAKCSIAFVEPNGMMRIVAIQEMMKSTELGCPIKLENYKSTAKLVRAETLEAALTSLGKKVGYRKADVQGLLDASKQTAEDDVSTDDSGEAAQMRQLLSAEFASPKKEKASNYYEEEISFSELNAIVKAGDKKGDGQELWATQEPTSPLNQYASLQKPYAWQPTAAPQKEGLQKSPTAAPEGPRRPQSSSRMWSRKAPSSEGPQVTQRGPERATVPAGFLPTEGRLEVYSNSRRCWISGILVGISLGTNPGTPAGSICVQYEAAAGQYTQKIIVPQQIRECIRR